MDLKKSKGHIFGFFLLVGLNLLTEVKYATGQPKVIHVTEGNCDCPKSLAKVAPYSHVLDKIPCYIDSAQFQSPNGVRSQNKPQLFGLNWATEPVSTHSKDVTSVTSPVTQSMTSHATSDGHTSSSTGEPTTSKSPQSESHGTYGSNTSSQNDVTSQTAISLDGRSPSDVMNSGKRTLSITFGQLTSLITEKTNNVQMTPSITEKTSSITEKTNNMQMTSSINEKTNEMQMTPSTYDITTGTSDTNRGTLELSTVTSTYNSTSISSTAPSSSVWLELVQLYDVDREKADKHFVTVQCYEYGEAQLSGMYIIEVEDVNDNTPVFIQSSLHTTVPASLNMGDALLFLQATDADIGLNAELQYGSVKGTEQVTYPNGTKARSPFTVLVLPSGFSILIGALEPESQLTLAVTVKDRGNRPDGNRATATATITVYDTVPPDPTPSPAPSKNYTSWLYYVVAGVAVLFFITAAVFLYLFRRRKKRSSNPMLVIDDSIVLDNDGEEGQYRNTRVVDRNHRHNHCDELLINEEASDDEVLIDLAGSEC